MAKQRMVDPKFWSDPWVRKLNPLDRYLFLYLLTNERSSWCGVYELDLGMMAFESGIDERDLEKSMLPRLSTKMLYVDGWVCMKNWDKYHDNGSEQTRKGIENAWNNVPDKIRRRIELLSKKDIPPIDPLQARSPSSSSFTSSSSSTFTAKPPKKAKDDEYSVVIDLFKEINPSYRIYFNRKPQQEAAVRLFKTHGVEKLTNVIGYVKANRGERYIPTIQSPYDLEEKWAKLESFAKREHTSKNNFII